MIAMSGCTLMLSGTIGDYQVDYQTTVDCLESLSIGTDEVLFVEKFGNVAERHSTFKRLTS